MRMIRLILPLLLLGPPALAQLDPSSREMIERLRPQGEAVPDATRGIRPVPPGATSGAPRTAPKPPARPELNLIVNFAHGSAALTPRAVATLDSLGGALASPELAGFRFRIEGHTDTTGSAALNLALSQRRAAAVADYVVARFGVDRARLEAAGLGETEPLVPTGDGVDEPRNRRVRVVNLGG